MPSWRRASALALLCAGAAAAQEEVYSPRVEPASGEGRAALASFAVAPGLRADLFAAEPLLANPVCLALDERGVLYVGETFRHHAGVTDIREHPDWLDEDFACQTVDDRLALLRRNLGPEFSSFAREHERIRRIVDTDGDGQADEATVFADGFADPLAGIGAGLLARDGALYYTCIPDLWRLRDADGDGRADARERLHTGYGVRITFLGHDLHGLLVGPDGRLYFSIGDRGLHVESEGSVLHVPDTGAVLRCELDGSHLELVHVGLRNPQELAFDDLGHLFTGDNNADSGDLARIVHVVPGGDSGWRAPYQWVDDAGFWNSERRWRPREACQPAFLLPPAGNLGNGPSGLTAFPGTGFDPVEWEGRFLLCDFSGSRSSSGVHAFRLRPAGASFVLGDARAVLWGLLATDCDFGPDGALYVSDWVEGWNQTGKGRVYRLTDPIWSGSPGDVEVRALLGAGVADRPAAELGALLSHADRRVRQEAHLELAARGADGLAVLTEAARASEPPGTAAHHALFGLGVLARLGEDPEVAGRAVLRLAERASDARAPATVREIAVRMLGDLRALEAAPVVQARLADEDARVRFEAALAAGRLGFPAAVQGLVALLRAEAAEPDPYLRHAAVMGLLGCAGPQDLQALASSLEPALRMAALLVWRARGHAELARFLDDPESRIVHEAARAIYDEPISAALPVLAARLLDAGWHARFRATTAEEPPAVASSAGVDPAPDARLVWRRALHANYRLGTEPAARALADFAGRPEVDPALAAEALDLLAEWERPPGRDRLTGFWWPLPEREVAFLPDLVRELLLGGAAAAPDEVATSWARLVESLAPAGPPLDAEVFDALEHLVDEATRGSSPRVAALDALSAFAPPSLRAVVERTLSDEESALRAAALFALERLAPAEALPRLPALVEGGELPERRAALRILGRAGAPLADVLLVRLLARLERGLYPDELALDVVRAAEARQDPEVTVALARRRERQALDPPLAPWLDALWGGERQAGRDVFERTQQQCQRCHESAGDDETLPGGPDLDGVGARLGRLQLLEALIDPNRRIAPGWGASNLFLADGRVLSGRVLDGGEGRLRVQTAEGAVEEIAAVAVHERHAGMSAMPEGLAVGLTREEMRDLIDYLAGR